MMAGYWGITFMEMIGEFFGNTTNATRYTMEIKGVKTESETKT